MKNWFIRNLILVLTQPPDPAFSAYGPISSTLQVEHFKSPGGAVVVVVLDFVVEVVVVVEV